MFYKTKGRIEDSFDDFNYDFYYILIIFEAPVDLVSIQLHSHCLIENSIFLTTQKKNDE